MVVKKRFKNQNDNHHNQGCDRNNPYNVFEFHTHKYLALDKKVFLFQKFPMEECQLEKDRTMGDRKIIKLAFHLLLLLLVGYQAGATIDASLQMQLGNPSGAIADTNNHNHYLIQRTVEAIDYCDNLGEPVWASWDLTADDIGGSGRNSTFYTDTNLPPNFHRVTTADYNGVGNIDFNRGHLCPSADRTDTTNDNKLVFYMSNIMPQSALNNQSPWGNFEDYCRSLLSANELLIICGPSGFGTNTIPSGKAYIPSNTWKIVVCVPLGGGMASSRVNADSRVIAISIPNVTNGLSSDWHTYLTSPRKIEQDTGLTFFTALPPDVAAALRVKVDGVTLAPILTATLFGTNLVISWPQSANGYSLQQNDNLITGWIPFASVISSNGATMSATNPLTPGNRFFRLVHP
jgi:endonuclease G